MNKFTQIVKRILSESPVGTNSKQDWVGSVVHRLILNRSEVLQELKAEYSSTYPGNYEDAYTSDLHYFETLADALSQKIEKAAKTLSIQKGEKVNAGFMSANCEEIISSLQIDESLASLICTDLHCVYDSRDAAKGAFLSSAMFLPFIVSTVADKVYDEIFAEENRDVEDYLEAQKHEHRAGRTGNYPNINVSNTDKEWDEDILRATTKVLPLIASKLRIPYSANKNLLKYTARLIAHAQEGMAFSFPMQRTGMGRGSGGDKRASEEIMSISANKREMVAKAVAAVESSEEFGKYLYKFTAGSGELDEHEQEKVEMLFDELPNKSDNVFTGSEIIQAGLRAGIATVPRPIRELIKRLIELNIVEATPVVKKADTTSTYISDWD